MKYVAIMTAMVLTLNVNHALAEDRRVEGTIKSFDEERMSLTIATKSGTVEKDETLDVLKKAKVTVNGQAAELKAVKAGLKAVVTVNVDLDVATKIDATGEVLPEPEIIEIKELPNAEAYQGAPWVTADGLTLYWKGPPPGDKKHWVWTATRKTKDDLFENAKRLVPGNDPTVTADGLEMILLDTNNLYSATRSSVSDPFQRPKKITEFETLGFLAAPCISGDGLTLYAEQIDFKASKVQLFKFTRMNRRSTWSQPTPVKFAGIGNRKIRFVQVSADRKSAFATLQTDSPDADGTYVACFKADAAGIGFESPRVIQVNGQPLRGKFARYIPATKELFFARAREDKQDQLLVVHNFDPIAHSVPLDAASVKATANSATKGAGGTGLQALQGEWLTIGEEANGKAAPKSDVKMVNRRIVIKDDSFTMTRVIGGRAGTYQGRITVKPQDKSFDWNGTGPSGMNVSFRGIYELNGDTLKLCYKYVKDDSTTRPNKFKTDSNSGTNFIFLTLKRDSE